MPGNVLTYGTYVAKVRKLRSVRKYVCSISKYCSLGYSRGLTTFWLNCSSIASSRHGRILTCRKLILDLTHRPCPLTHRQLHPPPTTTPTMLKLKNYSVADRVQALTLAEEGKRYAEISSITGMSSSQITRLRRKARERGFDPSVSKQITVDHVQDAPRSGRPEVIDEEKEKKMLEIVRATHESREMTAAEIARELGVGTTAVYKRLKKKKMGKWKPTYRPGIVFYIFVNISITYLRTKEELVTKSYVHISRSHLKTAQSSSHVCIEVQRQVYGVVEEFDLLG